MSEQNKKQRQCVHYWIIDSPDGHTSFGKCKYCGMVKEFSNNLGGIFTENKPPSDNQYSE
jgi:hypothetical protein